MRKVLVCGGRSYNNPLAVSSLLEKVAGSGDLVIHGGARGADTLAGLWAKSQGAHVAVVAASWDHYGKAAGMLRNKAMLGLSPDVCVAFPGGVGTAGMVRLCKAAGVPVIEAGA